jgi:hypothetical protein
MFETYSIQMKKNCCEMKAFILNGKVSYKNLGEKPDDNFSFKIHRKYILRCILLYVGEYRGFN